MLSNFDIKNNNIFPLKSIAVFNYNNYYLNIYSVKKYF